MSKNKRIWDGMDGWLLVKNKIKIKVEEIKKEKEKRQRGRNGPQCPF